MSAAGVTIGAVVGVGYSLFFAVSMRRSQRQVRASSLRGVVERLQARDGEPIELEVPNGGSVWNPGEPPGIRNAFYGPGHARYSKDQAGTVHLLWVPKHGPRRSVAGPVPVLPDEIDFPMSRSLKVAGLILAVFGLILAGWFGLSWLVHS